MPHLARTVSQPWTAERVGDELLAALTAGYTSLHARVGFVNASGVRHLAGALRQFRASGGTSQVIAGVDGEITSEAGVRALVALVDEVWLFRHPGRPLFHPKTYLFADNDRGLALIGSANVTESALWVNYEDLAVIEFDLREGAERDAFDELLGVHDAIRASPNAHRADAALIAQVAALGLLPSEAERRRQRHAEDVDAATRDSRASSATPLFPHSAVVVPPAVPLLPEEEEDAGRARSSRGAGGGKALVPPRGASSTQFVLRLGHRDAQDRRGYSPDVFIPLAAYRHDPDFWGEFAAKRTPDGNDYEERYATIEFRRVSGAVEREDRRLYLYARRAEFRLNARQVHEDALEGDLLSLELAPPGVGAEYIARVIRQSDPLFGRYDTIAANTVRNSDKRWGYA